MAARCGRLVVALFAVNLALQVFDAAATYAGCCSGMTEGNPLVSWAMGHLGPGPGLLLAKAQALALLALLWRLRSNWLVPHALVVIAVTYFTFSAVPWSVALLFAPLS